MQNYASDEADIRQRIDAYVAAIRSKDLTNVVSIFAPEMVSFDLEAPLEHAGIDGKRRNWARAFAAYEHPIGYEVRNFVLTLGDGVAFGRSLNRISGRLKGGSKADYWVRWSTCFRKIDGIWFIVHDHVSVPADVANRKAVFDLGP